MTRRQFFLIFRQAIATCLVLVPLARCTTVTPAAASHPGKSLQAQDDDKYQCWTQARFLTGHDPEGSSPMGRLLGAVIGRAIAGGGNAPTVAGGRNVSAVAVAIHQPSPTRSAVKSFREAYETCLTGRGYSVRARGSASTAPVARALDMQFATTSRFDGYTLPLALSSIAITA